MKSNNCKELQLECTCTVRVFGQHCCLIGTVPPLTALVPGQFIGTGSRPPAAAGQFFGTGGPAAGGQFKKTEGPAAADQFTGGWPAIGMIGVIQSSNDLDCTLTISPEEHGAK